MVLVQVVVWAGGADEVLSVAATPSDDEAHQARCIVLLLLLLLLVVVVVVVVVVLVVLVVEFFLVVLVLVVALVVGFFLCYFFIIVLLIIRIIAGITNWPSFLIVISILFVLVINVALMLPSWLERRFRTPTIVIHSYTYAPQVLHAFGNALWSVIPHISERVSERICDAVEGAPEFDCPS